MFKDSIRRFLDEKDARSSLRKDTAGTEDPYYGNKRIGSFDLPIWQEMIELGWTALTVPEAQGGGGMNLVTAASLCEELGRAAIATPLTVTLHTTFVLRQAGTDAAKQWLMKIAGGQSATLAVQDGTGSFDVNDTEVTVTGSSLLNGKASFVQDAQKVDFLVVAAKSDKGTGLYVVDINASGLSVEPDTIVDLTRDQACVQFSSVTAQEIASPGKAPEIIDRAMPALLTMVSADIAGAAEWQLQTTAEYAKIRTQFDRPIGFFQAVKHPIVDMMICADETRSLVYNAACAYDYTPDDADRCARLAKSSASDTASFCSNRSVQLHGGIGFTWEADVQIYFKRQKHNQFLFGDGAWQRQKLAELI
jgi:alkylation response protein AidB-like acyl-CoA dehydrogenase